MQRFITLALILAASTAHADDRDLKYEWKWKLHELTGTVESLRGADSVGRYSFDQCRETVKAATAAGVQPEWKIFHWKGQVLPFSEVGKLCDEYELYFHVAQVKPLFVQAQRSLDMLTKQLDLSQTDPANQASFEQSAKDCFAAADQADKLGIGDETLWVSQGVTLYFDEARAKICEPMAKAAASFAADVKKATEERIAELAAPYKAAGIKGDKLQYCIENANHNIYGVGGGSLEPAQIKKAKVLFALWTDSATGGYSLQRSAFKGDKFVGYSERKFALVPPPGAYK